MMSVSNSNIHPSIADRALLNAKSWTVGQPAIFAETKSGSIYQIDSDGRVHQTGCNLRTHSAGVLTGACYRAFGPIRTGQVVVGLMIEYAGDVLDEDDFEEPTCYTSRVSRFWECERGDN